MIDIDKILKEKHLSKTDLAKRMKLSRESLYRILSGNPTLDNINKLADALGVPITDLFEQPTGDTITCPKCGAKLEIKAKE
jgi:transcriptional regulator with XRE-family HTH domain